MPWAVKLFVLFLYFQSIIDLNGVTDRTCVVKKHVLFAHTLISVALFLPSLIHSVRNRKATTAFMVNVLLMNALLCSILHLFTLGFFKNGQDLMFYMILTHALWNESCHLRCKPAVVLYQNFVCRARYFSTFLLPTVGLLLCPRDSATSLSTWGILIVVFAGEILGFCVGLLSAMCEITGNAWENVFII